MIRTLSDVPGAVRRVLRKVDFVAKKKLSDEGHAYNCYDEPVVADVSEANVITSVVEAQQPEFLYDEGSIEIARSFARRYQDFGVHPTTSVAEGTGEEAFPTDAVAAWYNRTTGAHRQRMV